MAKGKASPKKSGGKTPVTPKMSASKSISKSNKATPAGSKSKKNDPWTTPPKGSLRERIRSGQHTWGTAPLAVHPWWAGKTATAGIDFVFIDTEHAPVARPDLSWVCKAYDAQGIVPIVRVPKPDHYEVSKVVDAGAVGVIAPYCETVE